MSASNTPNSTNFLKLVPESSAPVGVTVPHDTITTSTVPMESKETPAASIPAEAKETPAASIPAESKTDEAVPTEPVNGWMAPGIPFANDYPTVTHLKPTFLPPNSGPKAPSSLAMAGFARIDVPAGMQGLGEVGDKQMALKCLVGAWASFMNCCRKGDAEKIKKMGEEIFGEEVFEKAVEDMVKKE